MIYTVTLNPSLDYIVKLNQVELGSLNRSSAESKFPGGKGINVSQVLKRVGVNSRALGFIGGFTGAYIEDFLKKNGIETDFVYVNEDTRINVKIKAEEETELNAKGPAILESDFTALKEKIQNLTENDILVLAGSIPTSMPRNTYEELAKICLERKVKWIVDAEEELLKSILMYKPFLIKPNHHELGDFFNVKIESGEQAIPYAQKLVAMGAKNVIVSLADKGAIFVNKDTTLKSNTPTGELKSSVGAGDSMVAGFIAKYELSGDYEEAFRYSVASGSATAFSLGLCTKDKVEEVLTQVKIEKVKGEQL
ncbi:1-phosphofructokinase [Robertmurraya siralis]|uniref:Tagatose-6-phosphate kinase n=1 Tax=Robertmurraya siralis TaxID=77777 RepID=A0A919WFS3_9BACI|nr:1-phosphofructokinase [Robertmurraya siralis]PAE22626.1 1-phosphofructokinase [Bacillus sp. 7504-2]GIN60957.1 1-phosphofructokinase [Robertmurraya siralis]